MTKIFKNSLFISGGLIVGRVIGYIRELLIAYNFGADSVSDRVVLILVIPEMMTNILATGLAVKVIVPRLAGLSKEKETIFLQDSWQKILILISLGFFSFNIYSFFYFNRDLFYLLLFSTLAVFPNGILAIASSYLIFKERFVAQSFSNIIFNSIATLFIFFGATLELITVGFFFASLARLVVVVFDAKSSGLDLSIFKKFKALKSGVEISSSNLLYSFLGGSIIFINPLITRFAASSLQEGAVSIISYAEKLYFLPLSIIVTPYVLASFPSMSKSYNDSRLLLSWNKILPIAYISMIVAFFCFLMSKYLVNITFGITGMGQETIRIIEKTFLAYLPAMFFSGLSLAFTNIFFIYRKERLLLVMALLSVIFNCIGCWLVIVYGWSVVSLAFVYSIVSMIVFLLQLTSLIFFRGEYHGIDGN